MGGARSTLHGERATTDGTRELRLDAELEAREGAATLGYGRAPVALAVQLVAGARRGLALASVRGRDVGRLRTVLVQLRGRGLDLGVGVLFGGRRVAGRGLALGLEGLGLEGPDDRLGD